MLTTINNKRQFVSPLRLDTCALGLEQLDFVEFPIILQVCASLICFDVQAPLNMGNRDWTMAMTFTKDDLGFSFDFQQGTQVKRPKVLKESANWVALQLSSSALGGFRPCWTTASWVAHVAPKAKAASH